MAARKTAIKAKQPTARTTRGKTASKTKSKAFIPSNVNIRKAENGFTINAWDDEREKDITIVAKTKAELNRELSKLGIK